MKGKVEATIPQRQFENIRVSYEFEDEKSKNEAYKSIVKDCVKYHHIVQKKIEEAESKRPSKEQLINGIRWREVGYGSWTYFDESTGKWVDSPSEPIK